MKKNNPAQLAPVLVPAITQWCDNLKKINTYVAVRKSAISSRTSVSVLNVSSKPGVSMSVIVFPSRTNGLDACTFVVHDSRPEPTGKFELLRRFVNYSLR